MAGKVKSKALPVLASTAAFFGGGIYAEATYHEITGKSPDLKHHTWEMGADCPPETKLKANTSVRRWEDGPDKKIGLVALRCEHKSGSSSKPTRITPGFSDNAVEIQMSYVEDKDDYVTNTPWMHLIRAEKSVRTGQPAGAEFIFVHEMGQVTINP